jgi:hypothetical protein
MAKDDCKELIVRKYILDACPNSAMSISGPTSLTVAVNKKYFLY